MAPPAAARWPVCQYTVGEPWLLAGPTGRFRVVARRTSTSRKQAMTRPMAKADQRAGRQDEVPPVQPAARARPPAVVARQPARTKDRRLGSSRARRPGVGSVVASTIPARTAVTASAAAARVQATGRDVRVGNK